MIAITIICLKWVAAFSMHFENNFTAVATWLGSSDIISIAVCIPPLEGGGPPAFCAIAIYLDIHIYDHETIHSDIQVIHLVEV